MKILPKRLYADLVPAYDSADGRAWCLPGQASPVSLTDAEGRHLYTIILERSLTCGYEIGTGFGLSSLYAGMAMRQTGGTLISLDAYTEEQSGDYTALPAPAPVDEPAGLRFAQQWRDALGLADTVRYVIGSSPHDAAELVRGLAIDYAFIDGYHYGTQPVADVAVLLPSLASSGVLAFHDTQLTSVQDALSLAIRATGGTLKALNTRHGLAFVLWGETDDRATA